MSHGEVSIPKEDLEEFMHIARELNIKSLEGNEAGREKRNGKTNMIVIIQFLKQKTSIANLRPTSRLNKPMLPMFWYQEKSLWNTKENTAISESSCRR